MAESQPFLPSLFEPEDAERRATLRLEADDRVQCRFMPADTVYWVREIGFGGFSVEAAEPLPSGTYVAQFTANDHWSVTVLARTRYYLEPDWKPGAEHYILGFTFDQRTADSRRTIECLIDKLTSTLSFE